MPEPTLVAVIRRAEALAAEGASVTADSTLDALGFDSLDILSLAYGLEEEFVGFNGDDATERWRGSTTLGDIAESLMRFTRRHD